MMTIKLLSAVGLTVMLAAHGVADGKVADGKVAADPLDAYVGSWVSGCADSPMVLKTAPGATLKQRFGFTFSKLGASSLSFVMVTEVYPASGCSGTPLARHTNASAANHVSLDGSVVVGGTAAHKVTVTHGALGGSADVAANGILYPAEFFTGSIVHKDLLKVAGKSFYRGRPALLDEQGYPTAPNLDFAFTRP